VCNKWFDKKEGDGQIERELFPIGGDSQFDSSRCVYKVFVKTSDIASAGTDANVYIQLFGKHSNTDRIELKSSGMHKNKFERGHSDAFEISATDVGKIKSIRYSVPCANELFSFD
jgi:hypothetical protein